MRNLEIFLGVGKKTEKKKINQPVVVITDPQIERV
jgi:hypothetical protein